jgi:type 2 lantibiotic biosynthesis protein LanM
MDHPPVPSPALGAAAWYEAFTLAERAALAGPAGTPPATDAERERAARRLQRWRAQAPFANENLFAQRLGQDGLDEDRALALLAEGAEVLRARCPEPPDWVVDLVAAFTQPRDAALPSRPATPIQADEAPAAAEHGGQTALFLDAIAPLIAWGRARVRVEVQRLAQTSSPLPFDPATVEDLLAASLPRRLGPLLGRTMLTELHVARMQGLLRGETSAERFHSFLDDVRRPERMLALLQDYPVLARQLVNEIARWVACSVEFLERLSADWDLLRTTFGAGADPGVLVDIAGDAGDRHRGGHAVLIARFSGGLHLVYKPRSLAADLHLQELLAWLNARGDHLPFRLLTVLDRGAYGWVEYVEAHGCQSEAEVAAFYQRQGGYLALLHALGASDMHQENLIAAGEHPVLIDVEALFHPQPALIAGDQDSDPATDLLATSVVRVGLLPALAWVNAEGEGVDISGLGGAGGQLSSFAVPRWERAGTDEMHLVRSRVPLPGSDNRPTLRGADVDVLAYTADLLAGFRAVYHTLLAYRAAFLAEGGPLDRFAHDEVRVILRETRTYGVLLHESFHPDLLRRAPDRDRHFDQLWAAIPRRPDLVRVVAAEHTDLVQGDIPLFTARPSSRDLWTAAGVRIPEFFAGDGLGLARRCLEGFGADDLDRQIWLIHASLSTLAPDPHAAPRAVYHPAAPSSPTRGDLLAAARSIGDRLATLALRREGDVTWAGVQLVANRVWALAPLGADLYDGLPGVILFLAHLGARTGEGRYTDLARAALRTLRRHVEWDQGEVTTIGAFDGWGGIVYLLAHLAALWDQPLLLDEAAAVVARLTSLIAGDDRFDLTTGAAGCIGALRALHACVPSPETRAVMVQCGEHLLARAQPMEHGIGWSVPWLDAPETGLAHGAAGIAWALCHLGALTGDEGFSAAAREAVAYEHSLFSPEAGNWRYLRSRAAGTTPEGADAFMLAWCYGAPGIGLARLDALAKSDDAATRAEIDTALRTTLGQGFGHSHALCHGDLGNIELFLQAGLVLNDPAWPAQAERIAGQILDSSARQGWLCSNPIGVESPGLMTGLAGMGYQLLRLVDPARVPSVLTLAPPVNRSGHPLVEVA